MKKLTYWISDCIGGDLFVMGKNKTEVLQERIKLKKKNKFITFDPPEKITIKYEDEFDLIYQAINGIHE